MEFLDLGRQYKTIEKEIDAAVREVLESGKFILGEPVGKLEKTVADFCGVPYAVGLNSGTDAILLSLKAIGVKEGDEVITTPFTFIATAEAIALVGAKPVFADIDSQTFNLDPLKAAAKITDKTKAVIPVHLYGQMASMFLFSSLFAGKGIYIIEDAAQAIGAKYNGLRAGSFGSLGCFSFFPTKNLGACGDAGMAVSHFKEFADKIRRLRAHGSDKKYLHEEIGVNSRLDALQAAILRVKFNHLEQWNERRRKIACFYNLHLKDCGDIVTPYKEPRCFHIYHQYTVRTKRRDELAAFLKEGGIPTAIHYPIPLHLQPVFQYLGHKEGDFPEAEKAAQEVLSLPIFPEMTANEMAAVVLSINMFFH
ncbi:MAG: DegT/DnrJ/EryC1/StrS family aminotransferase [bacterium]|nr:DegT/DnrJ/EryC1/StrS family aminotransferase [bacterium]